MFLAEQLVAADAEQQPTLRSYLQPLGLFLLAPLETLFTNPKLPETQQVAAANALGDFGSKDAARLARLLSVASPAQYDILYRRLTELGAEAGKTNLLELAAPEPATDLSPDQRVARGQERAGAAITLLRRGSRQEMFTPLRVRDDPEALTQFVHRCRERKVQPAELLDCVEEANKLRQTKSGQEREMEDRVLFGFLLALGEFPLTEIPDPQRQPLIDRLVAWYERDPSSTIHGATGWLLRHWDQKDAVRKVDQTPRAYSPDRQWYTLEIKAKTGGCWAWELVPASNLDT